MTDGDASDTVTVSILSGDDASNKFAIDATNGKLIETSSNAINYEDLTASNYLYKLIVTGTDGTNVGTATVFVTVSLEKNVFDFFCQQTRRKPASVFSVKFDCFYFKNITYSAVGS